VSGFAHLLSERHGQELSERGRHFLDNIRTASDRMERLIDDLLRYARLARTPVQLRTVPLQPVFTELLEQRASRIMEEGARVRVPDDLPAVLGEPVLLQQIFGNLLDNALTYHLPDSTADVDISWRRENDTVVVRVRDKGIGIPAEHHEKVFRIFQRLHGDDQYPGTGIGLANVRKAIDHLRGDIRIVPPDDGGTCFHVTLRSSQ